LIEYLMKDEMELDLSSTVRPANETQKDQTFDVDPTADSSTATTNMNTPTQIVDSETSEEKERKKLTFYSEELEFIKKISSLFGRSPRNIKRYINIYRIVKSHEGLEIVNTNKSDEYIPVMLLLAIVVGHSEISAEFIKKLNEAKEIKTLGELFESINQKDGISTKLSELIESYRGKADSEILSIALDDLRQNSELISRFSFRTII
jgi:hypothetical protein